MAHRLLRAVNGRWSNHTQRRVRAGLDLITIRPEPHLGPVSGKTEKCGLSVSLGSSQNVEARQVAPHLALVKPALRRLDRMLERGDDLGDVLARFGESLSAPTARRKTVATAPGHQL